MNYYICEDFNIQDKVLCIYNPTKIGKVNSESEFNNMIDTTSYNAIICPSLVNTKINTILTIKDK